MSTVVIWLLVALGVLLVGGTAVVLARAAQNRSIEAPRAPSLPPRRDEVASVAPPLEVEASVVAVEAPPPTLATQLTSARSLFDRVRALRGPRRRRACRAR